MNKFIFLLIPLTILGGCYMFPYQSAYKKELKESIIIYRQKPIMYIARERKMFFIRLVLRENSVFTIVLDGFYGCGTYKVSADSIYLQYFNTEKIKGKKDIVTFNLKDSTAKFQTFLSKNVENLKVMPLKPPLGDIY